MFPPLKLTYLNLNKKFDINKLAADGQQITIDYKLANCNLNL